MTELTAIGTVAAGGLRRTSWDEGVRNPDIDYRVVEHLLDLVSVFDVDGRVAYASPSHRRVLGYEPDELVGRSSSLVSLDSRAKDRTH